MRYCVYAALFACVVAFIYNVSCMVLDFKTVIEQRIQHIEQAARGY